MLNPVGEDEAVPLVIPVRGILKGPRGGSRTSTPRVKKVSL